MKPSFKFIFIVSLFLSVVLSIVLSIVLPLVMMGFDKWQAMPGFVKMMIFLEGFIVSFVLSLILSLIIPAPVWGDKLAAALGAKPFSFPAHLISTAVVTLVLATLMSLAMVYYFNLKVPPAFRAPFGGEWLKAYPWVLVTIYISALIFAPMGVSIAKKRCGAPPMGVPGAAK